MSRVTEQKRKTASFVTYLIVFHLFWMMGFVFWIYPWMKTLGEATLRYALVNAGVRLLVWVLPVFLYLRYIDRVNPVDYLKLKQNWKRGVAVGVLLSLLNLFGSMIRFGWPHLNAHAFTWNSVMSTSILIGFVEEIPYRGFMLQKFAEYWGFWLAAILSSVLFLGMHLPGWISLHMLRAGAGVNVFVFGFVMAIVFRYTRSLWAPIITHSTNDFLFLVLFHP